MHMFSSKIIKNYRSEFDKFFHDFDNKRTTIPKSRKAEVEKHRKIFEKRDNTDLAASQDDM